MNEPEQSIWRGHPSQLIHFGFYALMILLMGGAIVLAVVTPIPWLGLLGIVPAIAFLWKWLEVSCRIFDITTERIKMQRGVLTRKMEELELYRVRDTTLVQPFWYRLFGKGNVILNTTDATTPQLVIECIPNSAELRERLRQAIEACRDKKKVRYAELGGELETDQNPPQQK
jgi:uncharacterized membrane protein YdbT with pleckstrin-like domain